ncbi:flagellar basal body P-ring formation chaperone FlgA (plasmid) [Paracoccus sp. TK19116]|uniref:Flagella basal body P-ring formation protein FlgA n=1 Tax=Paracoccus albicereus TaxID=2922394 RepID=A0ABT1MLE8_9RHOB|nr:flagellar basal body P-ring formation chaperone FlgA [Paracoccus albicereus]MCQ0969115.1 flagellar basal body P-ring formation chaperone FlgA [Paracoccus albicereus]
MMRMIALIAVCLLPGVAQAGGYAAARTLPAGTVIAPEDLVAEAGTPAPLAEAVAMVGLQTRVTIYEGRRVLPAQLRAPVLVSRNQIVRLIYRAGPLQIEAEGRALGEGAAGDRLRVMNTASRSTIEAQVNPDGTVTVPN